MDIMANQCWKMKWNEVNMVNNRGNMRKQLWKMQRGNNPGGHCESGFPIFMSCRMKPHTAKWNQNAIKSNENIKPLKSASLYKPARNIVKWERHIANSKEKAAKSQNCEPSSKTEKYKKQNWRNTWNLRNGYAESSKTRSELRKRPQNRRKRWKMTRTYNQMKGKYKKKENTWNSNRNIQK